MTARVFLSYSHADVEFARTLSKMLGDIHVDCFLDEKDILIGDQIKLAVHAGLRSCTEMIVVISPASIKSMWVAFEIGQAIALEKGILPIVIDPAMEPSGFFRELKYAKSPAEIGDYFLQKDAKQPGVHAVVLGAGTSGARMLELLLRMNVRVAGIYDKNSEAVGLAAARDHQVLPYYGSTVELCRLNGDCRKPPSVMFHAFLTSEHPGFVAYVLQHWQVSANCVLHRMGVDFPRDFTRENIEKLLS
jgi:hypothetical protein